MIKFKFLAIKNTNGTKDSLELCNLFEQLGAYLNYYTCENDSGYYIINENNTVEYIDDCNINETEYAKFTFSAFKTEYPYALNEIINLKNGESVRIFNMYWNGDEIVYEGNSDNGEIIDIKLKDIILKPDININNGIMNKKLAIKGHSTRTKEVIELLEMMGGKNFYEYGGKCLVDIELLYFFIANDSFIRYGSSFNDNFVIFTLEEFLEKYPFKVGDIVQHKGATSCGTVYVIEQIKWEDNQIKYIICDLYWKNCKCTVTVEDLQIYKEETMEDKETLVKIDLTQEKSKSEEIEVILGDYEFILKDGKTYFVKKKPKYPENYKECCEVLMGKTDFQDFELVLTKLAITRNEENSISPEPPKIALINNFYKLIICRDAYWKIAGVEMGLGKFWEPDWNSLDKKYNVYNYRGDIKYDYFTVIDRCLLVFPTAEMRNAFYGNFKELIEKCKELL